MKQVVYILFSIVIPLTALSQKQTKLDFLSRSHIDQTIKQKNGKTNAHFLVQGDGEQLKTFLEDNGGQIKYSAMGHYAIQLPYDRISELAAKEFITGFKFSMPTGQLMNDTMLLKSNVLPIHSGDAPLQQAYEGEGVIVGIIDNGIDPLHPDFLDVNGDTRVMYMWDQVQAFDAQLTPAKYGYGQVFDSSALNANTFPFYPQNTVAHGTTVAGAAAGNAGATGTHKGVAAKSELIVVRSDFNHPNWSWSVAEAVEYIYLMADSLGKPCVINASVGSYLGSHDGDDIATKFIDSIVTAKPGRLFACSAGNSHKWNPYHVRHDITSDTSFTWFQYLPNTIAGFPGLFFDFYADTADFNNAEFAIGADKVTGGYSFRGRTPFLDVKNNIDVLTTDNIMNGANTLAVVQTYASMEDDDTYYVQVAIANPDSSQYNYRFMTTGSGRCDIWSPDVFNFSPVVPQDSIPTVVQFPDIAKYVAPDKDQSIVSNWACSPTLITVGNYVNAGSYIDYNSTSQTLNGTPDSIAASSSAGPNRMGELKPEIAAPGDGMFSAAPSDLIAYLLANNPSALAEGGYHVLNGGTSMASPVIAGIGALYLERCPNATQADFMALITGTVKPADVNTGALPNNRFGYGKVDAFAALSSTELGASVVVNGSELSSDVTGSSYLWFLDNDTIVGETMQTHDILQNGDYYVQVTNAQGCKSNSDTVTINNLGIQEKLQGINIYPNPTKNLLNVSIDDNSIGEIQLELTDISGKVIYTSGIINPQQQQSLRLDLQTYPTGIYVLKVFNNNNSFVYRVLKE